jgi:outer membrane protein, multidrug efflux system
LELYTEGLPDFLNVLVAQRSLYTAEDALVQSNRNIATDLIALYKALGAAGKPCLPAGRQMTSTPADAAASAML